MNAQPTLVEKKGSHAACEKIKRRRERQEPTRKETRFISNQAHDSSDTHLLLRPALVVGCRWVNSFDDAESVAFHAQTTQTHRTKSSLSARDRQVLSVRY
jgi:hypothetical protein